MKFSLLYEGELKPDNKATPFHKQNIREEFNKQLKVLWESKRLSEVKDYALGVKTAGLTSVFEKSLEFPTNTENKSGWLENIKDSWFLPLVTDKLDMTANIKITWFREEKPGFILQVGDLDNRLKTLFDALQIPPIGQLEIIPKLNTSAETPYLTVLKDDALVSGLEIITKQLLKPITNGNVLLHIEVKTKVHTVDLNSMNFI